jgi:hypothetical protein
MSAADKYGSPVESIPSESLSQAKEAGQKLADNGVKQESSLGTGAPAPTPALKYGGNDTPARELKPESRSR